MIYLYLILILKKQNAEQINERQYFFPFFFHSCNLFKFIHFLNIYNYSYDRIHDNHTI